MLRVFGSARIVLLAPWSARAPRRTSGDPNRDRNVERRRRPGGAGGNPPRGGSGGNSGRGPGAAGGSGGSTSADAPVAGTGGEADGPEPPGDRLAQPATPAPPAAPPGAVVEVCTVAGAWVMKETCTAVCAAGACAGMCTPSSEHCGTDQTPETCNAAGRVGPGRHGLPERLQRHGPVHRQCKPGTKRCSGPNNLTTQTCDENGAWVNGTVCPNVCSSGSCGGDCMPGTKRCGANNVPQTCSPMGTWEPGDDLPVHLHRRGDCAGECRPGAKQCSGTSPRVRPERPLAEHDRLPELCMNGACTGDCTPGQKRCRATPCRPAAPPVARWRPRPACSSARRWRVRRPVCAGPPSVRRERRPRYAARTASG